LQLTSAEVLSRNTGELPWALPGLLEVLKGRVGVSGMPLI